MEDKFEYKIIKTRKLIMVVCPKCNASVEPNTFVYHLHPCMNIDLIENQILN